MREQSWAVADGLPQSSVTALDQGPSGLLHVGTFGGLAHFDGYDFAPWDPAERSGWTTFRVTALVVDDDGTSWLGFHDGSVVRIDPDGRDHVLPTTSLLAGDAIWSLATTPHGVWVGAASRAVEWNGHEWLALEGSRASYAVLHDAGVTFVGGEHGLLRVEADRSVHAIDVPPLEIVFTLHGHTDDLLVGGVNGVLAVRGHDVRVLDHESTRVLERSSDGRIWASAKQHLRVVGTNERYEISSTIRDLLIDREDNLWIGTDQSGLVRLVQEDWELVPIEGGVFPILELQDGSWLAGRNCGFRGAAHVVQGERAADELPGVCVRAFAAAEHGTWVALDTVIAFRHPDGTYVRKVEIGDPISSMLTVGDRLFVGTEKLGAFVYADDVATPIDVGDPHVFSIAAGPDGAIWFGTHLGLSRLADGAVERWTRDDGVPPASIRFVHVDHDGTVFLGSYGAGLGVFRDGVFHRVTYRNGLAENVVSAVFVIDEHLWLHGNRGLSRVRRDDLEQHLRDPSHPLLARRWSTPEGNGGAEPVGIVTYDHALLLPTMEGIVRLYPHDIRPNAVTPEVLVQRAEIDGLALLPGTVTEVPPGPGRVRIEFTAPLLRHPELARFEARVRSDGNPEPPWESADDRTASWDGFEPGRHIIELRAANEDNVWSEPVELVFVLAPHWYEWRSLWLGLAIVAACAGALAHRVRTRSVERHNALLRREVDQRRQAEEALRQSEAHYRQVFESGSDALFVLDPGGVVVEANAAAERLCGEPVVGRRLDALFEPESPETSARRIMRTDEVVWAAVVALPFEPGRTLVRAADVTRRVESEVEREAMITRLHQAERLEAVGRLAGGVAHDFNNLLSAMLGTASLLRNVIGTARGETAVLLDGLETCVDRGARLTRQLLAFARRQLLEPERLDPSSLVGGLQALLRPSLRDGVTLRFDLPGTRVGVYADPIQLEMAILNLLLNAQDAMPGGGPVTVRMRELSDEAARALVPELPVGDRWVVIAVEDRGVGIEAAQLAHVFEPFYTTRADGHGLGLPSVLGFAEQSGGALHLESMPGVGTTVSIVLPYAEPPPRERLRADPAPNVGGRGRVVICDDDDLVRSSMVGLLKRAGYEPLPYADAFSVLTELERGLVCDVLLTDVLMPGIAGPELARRVRELRPGLPVVFVSGYTRDQVDGALPGRLLAKPFRTQDVLAALHEAMHESERPPTESRAAHP